MFETRGGEELIPMWHSVSPQGHRLLPTMKVGCCEGVCETDSVRLRLTLHAARCTPCWLPVRVRCLGRQVCEGRWEMGGGGLMGEGEGGA